MTTPKLDGRRAKGEARRREILQAAIELFARGGFNSVSLGDVAKRVGITQAGILHYYPSKAALLLAVLQEREDRNNEAIRRWQEQGSSALESFVQILEENEKHPELVQLFVLLAAESTAEGHPGHDWFETRHNADGDGVVHALHKLIDVDKLPDGIDVDMIARWLYALPIGLGTRWVRDPTAFDRANDVARFIDILRPYMRNVAS